jgi:hypothetical protein
MTAWRFRTYRPNPRRDDAAQWYAALPPKSRAKVYRRLSQLRQWPRDKWGIPFFRMLHGECRGLGEVRIKLDRIQWRPIGFFGPAELEFTILLIAHEKGGKFVPRDTCSIGQTRMAEVTQSPDRTHEWFLDPNPNP